MPMVCPYCDMEISESGVEMEDGCCPECGAIVTTSSVLIDPKDRDYDDDYDDYDDDLDDLDDLEDEEDL